VDGIRYGIVKIKNGDRLVNFTIYKCNRCNKDVPECDPHYADENNIFCWECAFRNGSITSSEFVKHCGICLDGVKAAISPLTDEVEIITGKYFSWERPDRQQRNTPEYIKWRNAVFERDGYICQVCGKKGGNLNAHHIKSFAKNKKLRTVLSNGITLCEDCHKNLHKGVIKLE
jgi:DNA-directed RNA polymerase subunit RPC12/RpoP